MTETKVLHVITGLSTGGAETMLFKYLVNSDTTRITHEVIALTRWGDVASKIEDYGIKVYALNMRGIFQTLIGFLKLFFIIYRARPDIVQTWMYHSDFFAGVVSKILGVKKIIWNIRNTSLDPKSSKKSTIFIRKICSRLSFLIPNKIILCAESAAKLHQNIGYDSSKFHIIGNGFDTVAFAPSIKDSQIIRDELKINDKTFVVSSIARFDKQKDHKNFLRTAAIVSNYYEDVVFILCGLRINWENTLLVSWIKQFKLDGKVRLLNKRNDISSIMNASDVICSSSRYGEAFPNILGESLLCGTPCIATDIGDSKKIIKKYGLTVPENDSTEMFFALKKFLDMKTGEIQKIGSLGRSHIMKNYDIKKISQKYDELYLKS